MSPLAFYNEIDPFAAQWLRNLIDAGLIAPGVVDERDIRDIRPDELAGFTQCHFFAGIGVWSYSLRLAGWPDDRPVWTGSCPCQPFSAAGRGDGFADERHLWPAFHWLIEQCRPPVVLGEQVASKNGLQWLDLVSDDLEGSRYAFAAVDTSSALSGAPHIRQRLRFAAYDLGSAASGVADAKGTGRRSDTRTVRSGSHSGIREAKRPDNGRACEQTRGFGDRLPTSGLAEPSRQFDNRSGCVGAGWGSKHSDCGPTRGLVYDIRPRLEGHRGGPSAATGQREGAIRPVTEAGESRRLANTDGRNPRTEGLQRSREHGQQPEDGRVGYDKRPGPTNGFWRDADWLLCRDGKWRPVEPGTFPLAHGVASRVGRLRAYGNAVDAQATADFIAAFVES